MEQPGQNKSQSVELDEKVTAFLSQLYQAKPYFPEFMSKRVLDEIGFESSDEEAYKLVSIVVDQALSNLFGSMRNARNNSRRQKEEEASLLLTKDVLREMKRLGQDIGKPYQCPILFFKKEDDQQG